MYEGIDTVVLYEELAYEDQLPISWASVADPTDSIFIASCTERNIKVLQAVSALEEHGQPEKQDEHSPHHADIVRLDMKVNLLLDLLGHLLVSNQTRPAAALVRFNAHGAVWQAGATRPVVGDKGVLDIYLRECIVDPLRLIGQIVTISDAGRVKAKFFDPGEAVADLIEKVAFRRHRRQVAGVRHQRI